MLCCMWLINITIERTHTTHTHTHTHTHTPRTHTHTHTHTHHAHTRGAALHDAGEHAPGKTCGPELQELKLGGTGLQERASLALAWCTSHPPCVGFALDPTSPVTLTYKTKNFTVAAQPNSDWTAWWSGPPQPTPPPPPPRPPPPPDPPVPPTPDPVWKPCTDDKGCNLNGVCDKSTGRCTCDRGWRGENCELMSLLPPKRGDGTCDPSLNGTARGWSTTWGGRPIQDSTTGFWHYHVAEMANHCGMCSWASVSQVAHYISRSPAQGLHRRTNADAGEASVSGPYTRVDTAVPVFSHNPIVAKVPYSTAGAPDAYIMLHIGSGEGNGHPPVCTNGTTPLRTDNTNVTGAVSSDGRDGPTKSPRSLALLGAGGKMHIAPSLDGPWSAAPSSWTVPTCNNPHPLFLPNGRLMIACHDKCNLGFKTSLTDNWRTGQWSDEVCANITVGANTTFNGTVFTPANEDPDLYMDKRGNLHVITHNQSPCYSGKAAPFFGADVRGCGAHFFSDDMGETWSFAWHAVYNGTVV
jgi:hypothetical protein